MAYYRLAVQEFLLVSGSGRVHVLLQALFYADMMVCCCLYLIDDLIALLTHHRDAHIKRCPSCCSIHSMHSCAHAFNRFPCVVI